MMLAGASGGREGVTCGDTAVVAAVKGAATGPDRVGAEPGTPSRAGFGAATAVETGADATADAETSEGVVGVGAGAGEGDRVTTDGTGANERALVTVEATAGAGTGRDTGLAVTGGTDVGLGTAGSDPDEGAIATAEEIGGARETGPESSQLASASSPPQKGSSSGAGGTPPAVMPLTPPPPPLPPTAPIAGAPTEGPNHLSQSSSGPGTEAGPAEVLATDGAVVGAVVVPGAVPAAPVVVRRGPAALLSRAPASMSSQPSHPSDDAGGGTVGGGGA